MVDGRAYAKYVADSVEAEHLAKVGEELEVLLDDIDSGRL